MDDLELHIKHMHPAILDSVHNGLDDGLYHTVGEALEEHGYYLHPTTRFVMPMNPAVQEVTRLILEHPRVLADIVLHAQALAGLEDNCYQPGRYRELQEVLYSLANHEEDRLYG